MNKKKERKCFKNINTKCVNLTVVFAVNGVSSSFFKATPDVEEEFILLFINYIYNII
jgi:hypothetical protein